LSGVYLFDFGEFPVSLDDFSLNLDSDLMMYALIGLLFLWLFFRIFKRTEKPRARAQVSGKSASWNDDSYSR
jgi:hypothetical protein